MQVAQVGPGRALRLHLRYVGGQRASFRVEAVNPAFVRLSVQGYNTEAEVARLLEAPALR